MRKKKTINDYIKKTIEYEVMRARIAGQRADEAELAFIRARNTERDASRRISQLGDALRALEGSAVSSQSDTEDE